MRALSAAHNDRGSSLAPRTSDWYQHRAFEGIVQPPYLRFQEMFPSGAWDFRPGCQQTSGSHPEREVFFYYG